MYGKYCTSLSLVNKYDGLSLQFDVSFAKVDECVFDTNSSCCEKQNHTLCIDGTLVVINNRKSSSHGISMFVCLQWEPNNTVTS